MYEFPCAKGVGMWLYIFVLYINIEHTTFLLVEMEGAESEVGEHNASGTTLSLA